MFFNILGSKPAIFLINHLHFHPPRPCFADPGLGPAALGHGAGEEAHVAHVLNDAARGEGKPDTSTASEVG